MPDEPPKPPAMRTRAAKPRAGIQRKTREEREQFAKQEAERQQARNAEASKNASPRGAMRGGRGGRGARAGASAAGSGDSRARDTPGSGGGVFGVGTGLRSMRVRNLPEGYSEMLGEGHSSRGPPVKTLEGEETGGGSGSGGGGGGGGGRSTIKANRELNDIDVASDDEPDELKRDIERIWISSDEDEDEDDDDDDEDEDAIISAKRKQKAVRRTPRGPVGLRPVRAPRAPREEDEYKHGARNKSNRALKKSESDMHDHEEADENAMDIDEQPVSWSAIKDHPPSSPGARRRSMRKPSTKSREMRIATETIEERAERERIAKDTDKLRHIFLGRQSPRRSATVEVAHDEEDEEKKDIGKEAEDEASSIKSRKLFLFQLPPLTPFLYDPSTEPPPEPQVKQEPGVGTDDPSTAAPSAGPSAPGIKKELSTTTGADAANASAAAKQTLQLDGLLTATEPRRLPAGLVGKLRVHKSGKVSLDWGGTDMEVRYGTEVDFLQDAVLVETKKEVVAVEKEKEKDENGNDIDGNGDGDSDAGLDLRAGKGYALGQVRKKMVLIPDWAKLYD